jgi:hypothetical protein
MGLQPYAVGALVRVSASYVDINNVAIDPTAVILSYKNPLGVKTTFTYPTSIIKDSVGHYHYDIDTTGGVGVWYYRWSSTGTGQAAADQSFTVLVSLAL